MTDLPPDLPLGGACPARFDRVRDVFQANFAGDFAELGARFTACIDGEVVLDLWGGYADRDRTKPYDDETLSPVFSTTKAAASLMMAWRVGQGGLDYGQLATDIWPAFGQHGKDRLKVEQVLSHQSGLSGLKGPLDPDIWFDPAAVAHELEIAEPLWPPGTASGYSPMTFGYLAGELFRPGRWAQPGSGPAPGDRRSPQSGFLDRSAGVRRPPRQPGSAPAGHARLRDHHRAAPPGLPHPLGRRRIPRRAPLAGRREPRRQRSWLRPGPGPA